MSEQASIERVIENEERMAAEELVITGNSEPIDGVDVSPSIPVDSDDTGNSGDDNCAWDKHNGSDEPVIGNYSIESNINIRKQKAEIDDEKIEAACKYIVGTAVIKLSETMLDVGQYLIKNFYGDNYALAAGKRFTKDKSLNKLIFKIKSVSIGNAPSQTWLYDAVNYAIDNHQFSQDSVYVNLGHSFKVNLTYAPDFESKTQLIKEAADKKMTVADLRRRIKELKSGNNSRQLSVNEEMTSDKLSMHDLSMLKEVLGKVEKKEQSLREQLTLHKRNIVKLKEAIAEKGDVSSNPQKDPLSVQIQK